MLHVAQFIGQYFWRSWWLINHWDGRCSLLRDLAVTLRVASVVFGVWRQPANPPWQYVEHKTIQRVKVTICYQRVSLTCQCFIASSLELNEKRGSSRKCACFMSAGLQLGPLKIPCFNHRSTPWRAGTCSAVTILDLADFTQKKLTWGGNELIKAR